MKYQIIYADQKEVNVAKGAMETIIQHLEAYDMVRECYVGAFELRAEEERCLLNQKENTAQDILEALSSLKASKGKPPLANNPYTGDVHLDAGVYDGLYHKVFEFGRQAQRELDIKWYENET